MKRVSVGGQAVLEGVMMKGPDSYALAVRKPDNEIAVKVTEYKSLGERYKILTIPILRGVVNFLESLYIGMKTLMDYYIYQKSVGIKLKKLMMFCILEMLLM